LDVRFAKERDDEKNDESRGRSKSKGSAKGKKGGVKRQGTMAAAVADSKDFIKGVKGRTRSKATKRK